MTPQIYRNFISGAYCIVFGTIKHSNGEDVVLYQGILDGKMQVMPERQWGEYVGPAMSGTPLFQLVKPMPFNLPGGHTLVVHCKKAPYDVYIGRPSKWGNPYKVGPITREEAIEKYLQDLINDPFLLSHINEIQGKVLGCYCKPEACHGDILARLANAYNISASL